MGVGFTPPYPSPSTPPTIQELAMQLFSEWLAVQIDRPAFYWYLILLLSSAAYLFETYIEWRQYRQICKPGRPKELAELCSNEEYLKSREYAIDRMRFGFVSGLLEQVRTLFVLFGGFLPWLWIKSGIMVTWLAGHRQDMQIIQSLVFFTGMLLFSLACDLPCDIYSTFWLEKKHGFSQTTKKLFVTDKIKVLLLSLLLGTPILAGLLWAILRTGDYFYVAAWLLLVLVQLVILLIYPTLIQPLFNTFTPLAAGELKERIEALAKSVNFPLKKILVVDGSRRFSHSNAYFFGFFKNRRIVLYDTLLEQGGDPAEICAIVGHELGHWARNHVLKRLVMVQAHLLLIFYLFGAVINRNAMYAAFGFSDRPVLIGLLLFQYLLMPLELFLGFLTSYYSRYCEFEADRYAIDLGHGERLPSALIKQYTKNKSLIHPDWLYSTMHHSHPPPSERLEAMRLYSLQTQHKTQ